MPNDIAKLNNLQALMPRLPNSVERALADAAELSHPDVPWTPPPGLPSPGDLRRAIDLLSVEPVSARMLSTCLAALVIAFEPNTKLSPEATRLRFEVWKDAVGDLGDALLQEATQRAIKSLKWMPKPSEVRDQVRADLDRISSRLNLCRRMLSSAGGASRSGPFTPEPRGARLRGLRDSFRGVGDVAKAAGFERELAKLEGREPEDWTKAAPAERPPEAKRDHLKLPEPSPEMRAALNRSLARRWRGMGNADHADKLEAEAQRLVPIFDTTTAEPE